MSLLGYARVSTRHQSTDGQEDALAAGGAERIFRDVMSGARNDRPGLAALLEYAREGDIVIVVALDRLGRSLSGVIRTIETLHARGVHLRSLRESIDTSTAVGQMLAGVFASLAQYERTLIAERAQAAREAAAARGKHVGRPKAVTANQVVAAQAMRRAGQSMLQICSTLGVSRSALYRELAAAGATD